MNYEYEPLKNPSQSIRILYLMPKAFDESLHGDLVSYARQDLPNYRPVSYAWGNEKPSSEIFLQSVTPQTIIDLQHNRATTRPALKFQPLHIRPNLETFLKTLRHDTAITTLWVDAICINQGDDDEKAHQVNQMDQVYRGQDVFIWLGEASKNSHLAISLIVEYNKRILTAESDDELSQAIDFLVSSVSTHRAHWAALWELLGRPWFTRRWIVQECVLSAEKKMFIGDIEFRWDWLVAVATQLPWSFYPVGPELVDLEDAEQVQFPELNIGPPVDRFGSLKRLWITSKTPEGHSWTLEELLERFYSYTSSDPRDAIYSFVSMTNDIERPRWLPDYSSNNTTMAVYEKAFYHVVSTSGSLDILCRAVPALVPATSFPSWLPWYGSYTFDIEGQEPDTVYGYNGNSLATFGQLSEFCLSKPYTASGKSEIQWPRDPPKRNVNEYPFLKLDVWIVDTIRSTGPWANLMTMGTKKIFGFADEWAAMLGFASWDHQNLPDAFYRALTGNRLVDVASGSVVQPPDDWAQSAREFCSKIYRSESGEGSYTITSLRDTQLQTSMHIMMSNQRRFATTGASLGFVPTVACEGDFICILAGCSVPLVLRQVQQSGESCFALMGECYIDGIMDGEFMKFVELKNIRPMKILLA